MINERIFEAFSLSRVPSSTRNKITSKFPRIPHNFRITWKWRRRKMLKCLYIADQKLNGKYLGCQISQWKYYEFFLSLWASSGWTNVSPMWLYQMYDSRFIAHNEDCWSSVICRAARSRRMGFPFDTADDDFELELQLNLSLPFSFFFLTVSCQIIFFQTRNFVNFFAAVFFVNSYLHDRTADSLNLTTWRQKIWSFEFLLSDHHKNKNIHHMMGKSVNRICSEKIFVVSTFTPASTDFLWEFWILRDSRKVGEQHESSSE